jgi:hypothetical protein
LYLLLVLLLVAVVLDRLTALALLVRLVIGLFGFLLVYRVVAERERVCSAVVFRTALFCILLLERFAAPAAVMELLRRVVAFEFAMLAERSAFAAVRAAAVVPVAPTLLERLLPLVSLASLDLPEGRALAPYLE